MTSATRLVFCTTGVLLRQLQSNNALENITHIVIDEVHERHLDSEFLTLLFMNCLEKKYRKSLTIFFRMKATYCWQF